MSGESDTPEGVEVLESITARWWEKPLTRLEQPLISSWLRFWVPGEPIPQGSKSISRSGRMYEANPRLRAWREAIAWGARQAYSGPVLDQAVRLDCVFVLPHSKVSRKEGRVWHTAPPDRDKLLRAVQDALTGILYVDDSRVCAGRTDKFYGPEPGVRLEARWA